MRSQRGAPTGSTRLPGCIWGSYLSEPTVEDRTASIIGATPSSMNAGSTQTPSGIISVVPSFAASSCAALVCSRRNCRASLCSRSAAGTPARRESARMRSTSARPVVAAAFSRPARSRASMASWRARGIAPPRECDGDELSRQAGRQLRGPRPAHERGRPAHGSDGKRSPDDETHESRHRPEQHAERIEPEESAEQKADDGHEADKTSGGPRPG